MSRGRLVIVAGTRPEFIKLGPVVAELRQLGSPVTLVQTGQHTDLLDGNPAREDMSGAMQLGLASDGDADAWTGRAVPVLHDAFASLGPIAAVVVQGDTMTAHAAAVAASGWPIAHVEAGVRSHCLTDPFPEEGYRREITQLADWHYTPTPGAVQNLLDEGVAARRIIPTGNTTVSALYRYAGWPTVREPIAPRIIITLHRRELLQRGHGYLTTLLDTLYERAHAHPDVELLWPLHPAMRMALADALRVPPPPNILYGAPVGYRDMIDLLCRSTGVITDSGGLTEEATTLGTPLVTLRHHTDRPEASGALYSPTPTGLRHAIDWLAKGQPRIPSIAFGRPEAARLIAVHLHSLT